MSKRFVKLKPHILQVRGISYKPHQISEVPKRGYIPLLRAINIVDGKIDMKDVLFVKESLVKEPQIIRKGDILLSASSGSLTAIGKSAIYNGDETITFGAFCKLIRTKDIHPEYIIHYLHSKKFRRMLQSQINGSNIKNLKNEHLNNLEVYLPNIIEQTRIANLLNKTKQIIEKRQSQITALDELTQSVFLEMFGDPNGFGKYPKAALSKFGKIITGNTPPRKEKENYGEFIEWIKSDNINTPYTYLTEAKEYLSEKGMQKGRTVPRNSILVTCIAGSRSCIGNVAVTDRPVAFNQQINAIIPEFNPYYLYVHFLVGKRLIQNASTDGMKGLVSKGVLKDIKFILPPLKEQNKFGTIFLAIEAKKSMNEESLERMVDLYNSLLQKAFKGELFQEKKAKIKP